MRQLATNNDIQKTKENMMMSKSERIAIEADVHVYDSTFAMFPKWFISNFRTKLVNNCG